MIYWLKPYYFWFPYGLSPWEPPLALACTPGRFRCGRCAQRLRCPHVSRRGSCDQALFLRICYGSIIIIIGIIIIIIYIYMHILYIYTYYTYYIIYIYIIYICIIYILCICICIYIYIYILFGCIHIYDRTYIYIYIVWDCLAVCVTSQFWRSIIGLRGWVGRSEGANELWPICIRKSLHRGSIGIQPVDPFAFSWWKHMCVWSLHFRWQSQ